MKKLITIEGMMCNNCATHVHDALLQIDCINKVKVDLEKNNATIKSDVEISDDVITNTIYELGYKVLNIEIIY